MPQSKKIHSILIVGLTPEFADKPVLWFSENEKKIRAAFNSQTWWREHALKLESGRELNPWEFLRQLEDLKYEKTFEARGRGEYAHRGGIVDVFPINSDVPYRLEFLGQTLESILPLEKLELEKTGEARKRLLKKKRGQELHILENLKSGDYVVHLDHGIGIFRGKNPLDGKTDKIYYILEYAKNDKLYVPESASEKLARYVGFETPVVHRLGGALWNKTKKRIKEGAEKLARELLGFYAERAAAPGFSYPPDDELQREFEADFEHIETDDQARVIREVKEDMEKDKPMDRLVCGDVGFGKTEVALRAAFKAVIAGKQVALITPTTILADQHYETFRKRMDKFSVNVAALNRLVPVKIQKKVVGDIKEGRTDIVIGTHRLLSGDISFKNLGLVIIDEEQRFGVKQKEKLKRMRATADVLSLSATPIPRTLYFALSGLREMSIINTPPFGRLSPETTIKPYDKTLIKNFIERERKRGGQVFYLHNRIETMEAAKKNLMKLVPAARWLSVHGKASETAIIGAIRQFRNGEADVLMATTIIENGLDLPNANTLIVADAARLGLAQAYQIRGRVGRGNEKSYALFLYNSKNLTEKAAARLEALKEAETLGSGYSVALRDLELRGGGNILGREQSGQINQIGLNLYCQILNEAVEELKNEEPAMALEIFPAAE